MELHARLFAAAIALTAATLPAGAFAQQTEPAPPPVEAPSYALPAPPPAHPGEETIHGRIASFDGGYNLQVNDDRGFIDSVRMHQGTIINPTGLTLAPGMVVTIYGVNSGQVFAAHQIDTPYQTYAYPVYPYPVYGYPFYGYPFFGPYGARVSIGFGFGFGWGGYGGYPHRGYFH